MPLIRLRMFLSDKGGVGRYPREDREPGRMQVRRHPGGLTRVWRWPGGLRTC
jgi:hypothetical protein